VEFGLLVDTLARVGLDAMAQVDLVRRKHRNSSVTKLGRMAAEIMQVAIDRLEREGRLKASAPPYTSLTQFERDGTGYRITTTDITERERPPLATLR
jgi:glucosyl-3-phosphoglycerate synthase